MSGETGFDRAAVCEQLSRRWWRLVFDLRYADGLVEFTVPAGTVTDFASVPKVLLWFATRSGSYTRAAILHDYLWNVLVEEANELSHREADRVFRHALRLAGVSSPRRWVMWAAVRWGALVRDGGMAGWWREAHKVVPITLLALPVILPPALLAGAAGLLVRLLEFVLPS